MRKLMLILRARLWPLLLLGLLGAAAAVVFSTIRNDRIEPEFRAEAPLTLHRSTNDTSGRDLNARVNDARAEALDANADLLGRDTAEITSEIGETEAQLLFVAYAPSREEASDVAVEMRDRYLDVEPIGVEAVETQLAAYSQQVEQIRSEIAVLEGEKETSTEDAQALALLSAQIAQLQSRAVQLAVDLALYEFSDTERSEAEIEQELQATRSELALLEGTLAEFQSADPADTERDLRIQALRQQEADVTNAYLNLFLNQVGAAELTTLGTVDATDVSPNPISRTTAGVGGFLLALLLGIGAILVFDLLRRPVWSTADIRGSHVIGRLTPRRVGGSRSDYWYDRSPRGRRLGDIAAIRADIDPAVGDGPVSIGLTRTGASARDLQAAVADLGMSLAAVGKSVILIDADFDSESHSAEFQGKGPSLAELLSVWTELAVTRVMVKEALESSRTDALNVRGLASGSLDRRPAADVLAGPGFGVVLAEARELADVILVAAPEAGDPASLTLAQRLDHMVILAKARSTTQSQLEEATSTLQARKAVLLGVILQGRKRERRFRWLRRLMPRTGGAHVKRT